MKPLNRRELLRYLATGLGVGATGFGLFSLGGCSRIDTARLSAELVALVTDRPAVSAIGNAYLEKEPRATLEMLAQRLAAELDWREAMAPDELAAHLLARIERDFEEGRTLRVKSWVLSQTEVRWAALVALSIA